LSSKNIFDGHWVSFRLMTVGFSYQLLPTITNRYILEDQS